MLPSGTHIFPVEAIENSQGQSINTAPGSGHVVRIAANIQELAQLEHGYLIRHWSDTQS